MKGVSFCVQFINTSECRGCWYEHLTAAALACCGFITATAANIPMVDATNTMVSIVVAFLITVVSSHHCYYYQVY
jgi:uncharacterized membrane protein